MLNKNLLPRPRRRTAPLPEQTVVVRGDHITLGQLLKTADIVGSGGEAKLYLADIGVLVNGEPEQRRGRKLRPGDLIVVPDAPPIRLAAPSEVTQDAASPDSDAMTRVPSKNKNKMV